MKKASSFHEVISIYYTFSFSSFSLLNSLCRVSHKNFYVEYDDM